jgi:hypothetical protein
LSDKENIATISIVPDMAITEIFPASIMPVLPEMISLFLPVTG